ncbi:acetyl-CoA C-acyltransferase [Aquisalimonas sp.]|uniref:acetyl-CoA C-acyltransferase n=1 Tax=unclassified Aquisalimonas TaxID=2644645 RepID=UPI0025C50897|nr:acetyl-CoA C-acyltransferase [Aquisalimonas sp.]
MQDDPIVIVGSARTPMGGLMGDVSALPAPELGSASIAAALERAGVPADAVNEVFMGNVLPAGLGQAPARQAALGAGLPLSVPCTTVSKVCGSGMRATMFAHDVLALGRGRITVAGGMESMSRAPYLLDRARSGYRLGHGKVTDHMFFDGLEDAYEKGELMGAFAERCASHYSFTREAQDDYAEASLRRARKAAEDGTFDAEITPVTIRERRGERTVSRDEQPWNADPDKLRNLKPAFDPQGTVTAANASSISDGAAALVLMPLSEAEKRGLTPLAAIRGQASHAREPQWFTTAPVGAMTGLLEQVGWSAGDVDLWEINEAFAVVVMAAMKEMGLPHDTVNVHGGACALGHPIGASGARILVTLLNALQTHGLKRGVASLCIGGGEATAVAVERLD